jgi:hypothetical protein
MPLKIVRSVLSAAIVCGFHLVPVVPASTQEMSAPPKPCPMAGCGAPAWRPTVVSFVPTESATFDELLRHFQVRHTPSSPTGFEVVRYGTAEDLSARLSIISRRTDVGAVAILGGRLIEQELRLWLRSETKYPVAFIELRDASYSYELVNSLPHVRQQAHSASPVFIGEDARHAVIEWWGEWKRQNLSCCQFETENHAKSQVP